MAGKLEKLLDKIPGGGGCRPVYRGAVPCASRAAAVMREEAGGGQGIDPLHILAVQESLSGMSCLGMSCLVQTARFQKVSLHRSSA